MYYSRETMGSRLLDIVTDLRAKVVSFLKQG